MNKTSKILLFCTLALGSALSLMAFKMIKDDRPAKVHPINGVYIFIDCEPAEEYTTIGNVTRSSILIDREFSNVKEMWIKKAASKYGKTYDGLIMGGDMDNCIAIKFKE